MAVYRLDLAYDGSRFHGYAKQRDVRTVQGELEAALEPILGPVETFVAGRTDRGVHATGQVASFRYEGEVDPRRLRRSLNARLGPEIAVRSLEPAQDDFHARFSAKSRAYRYLVIDDETPDPFLASQAWSFASPLDETAMNGAAAHFVGEHDFASFCRRSADRSTVRDVRRAAWSRLRPGLLAFDIEASSFCHQMVRSIVALCVDVGRGRVAVEAVPRIVAARDRSAARGVAPAHGLTLVRVDYDQA